MKKTIKQVATSSSDIEIHHIADLTIPNHKEISKGTLRAIMRQSGLSREEFFRIL